MAIRTAKVSDWPANNFAVAREPHDAAAVDVATYTRTRTYLEFDWRHTMQRDASDMVNVEISSSNASKNSLVERAKR